MREGFINRRAAVGRIAPYTIAAYAGPNRQGVVQSSGSSAEIAGVTDGYGASGDGVVELRFIGAAEVRAGGQIAQGDMVVSDDRGRAITFFGPVGAEACFLGQATQAAEEHDLCRVELLLLPGEQLAAGPSGGEMG